MAVLPDGRVAGLVNTTSRRGSFESSIVAITELNLGIAIYEFPEIVAGTRISPKIFKPFDTMYGYLFILVCFHCPTVLRLSNLTSQRSSNKIFSVALVEGFLCLLVLDGESLEVLSTRPFSCVTKEEGQMSSVAIVGLSPDSGVVFLMDKGLGSIMRMEVASGNCRCFLQELSCKYKNVLI